MKKNARRNGKLRKALMMVCCMALLVGITIGGTVAWLTAQTESITNTFTVGDINITLAETTGTEYKVIPGTVVDKDPTVTVVDGSEKCWVFVSVTNNLVIGEDVVGALNIDSTAWKHIGTNGNTKVYAYGEPTVVDATETAVALPVFTQVTIDAETVTKENIAQLANQTIVVDAYAHQSDNTTYEVAEAAALEHFGADAVSGN